MKRFLIPLCAVIIIILSTTAIVSAHGGLDDQDVDMMRKASSTRPGMGMDREEFRENLQEKREEFKGKFDDFRKQKVGGMIEMMKRRFTAAVERLENIADRIETRIDKIEDEQNTTLTDARNALDDAHEHLDDAQDALDDISTSTAQLFVDATSTGQRFGHIHDLFKEAKEAIVAARESLRSALKATGQWHGKDAKHSTSTNQ